MNKKITSQSVDFSQWYLDIIYEAGLVDQSPTRGCMVIKPYGYGIWELIQKELDARIKDLEVENAYFPLLIPEEFLQREAKHIEGFSPELAVVTHAGGKKLEENFVIRPTSETMIYYMFSRWIKSWRDLPLKINQWANVMRWEMRTRPFLRTSEFLWQEGHTAHKDKEEALEMSHAALNLYADFAYNFLAIPVITGEKSDAEKFPGAEKTFTFEGIMPDGKALQMGTSHLLSLSFPASFGVSFQNKDNNPETPWCTSWGTTTRLIGAMVMSHSDDKGLVIPPFIAPIQVMIIPITPKDQSQLELVETTTKIIFDALKKADIRVKIDKRPELSPGAKFFDAELKGIPLRVEIGQKEAAAGIVLAKSRIDTEKISLVIDENLGTTFNRLLKEYHTALLDRATQARDTKIKKEKSYEKFQVILEGESAIISGWCKDPACEQELKKLKAFSRCLLSTDEFTECFFCKNPSLTDLLIGKSY